MAAYPAAGEHWLDLHDRCRGTWKQIPEGFSRLGSRQGDSTELENCFKIAHEVDLTRLVEPQ